MASLCKLLELLAPVERPLSELVAELPELDARPPPAACPWALKGLVMRVLTERLKGREVDLTDGIKVIDERGWAQVLPDPDEPLVHIYAEGGRDEQSERARERAADARRGGRCRDEAAGKSQAEVEPLTCYCFTAAGVPQTKGDRWNRFPTWPNCPMPTSRS